MNTTDILKEILRGGLGGGRPSPGRAESPPGAGDVFKDIFGGGRPRVDSVPPPPSTADLAQQAKELEELFGVGREPEPRGRGASAGADTGWRPKPHPPSPRGVPTSPDDSTGPLTRRDAEGEVLIRAMVKAAKSDGRFTRDEQQALLDRLGGASREAIDFVRREMDAPVDTREFAWSVPLGMEYKVYAASLSAIDLDSKSESEYLAELGHGLRLPVEVRAHIHQRYGAPPPQP